VQLEFSHNFADQNIISRQSHVYVTQEEKYDIQKECIGGCVMELTRSHNPYTCMYYNGMHSSRAIYNTRSNNYDLFNCDVGDQA
jgi:patatin-like phospholipase/acyl hydrolase